MDSGLIIKSCSPFATTTAMVAVFPVVMCQLEIQSSNMLAVKSNECMINNNNNDPRSKLL